MRIAEFDRRKNSSRPPVAHSCPICGDDSLKNCYAAKEMVNGTREKFDYYLCSACGTLYLGRRPTDISPYYANYYSTGDVVDSPRVEDPFKQRIKNILCRVAMRHPGELATKILDRWLKLQPYHGFESLHNLELPSDAAILDVGCGNGIIVEALDRIGFTHVCGCDPFIAREKTFANGSRVLKAKLGEVPGLWDLIMLHHCFEHVEDPRATARLIAEKLTPGGRCLLRFPNVDSVEFARYGENWWGLHAPRHYFLLSQKAMKLVWEDTGMQIQHVWCDSQPDHYYYSYEYMLDLPDNDSGSIRAAGGDSPHWDKIEFDHIAHNVSWYNERLIGDWIGYILRKED